MPLPTHKICTLSVHIVDAHNRPKPNVAVKVLRIEKEPISIEQWAKNLRDGTAFKLLMSSMDTDNNGEVAAEFPIGTYEVKVEKYSYKQVHELTQNAEIFVMEPKKHWWH